MNMADVDPVLVREHARSWHGFTNFVKWGTVTVIAVLFLLWLFVA
jgi:Bacterial aa3 type cytochrome c oxidase subunit IV